jgi:hypothetical protein
MWIVIFLFLLILSLIYILNYTDTIRWMWIDCHSLRKLDKEYCNKPLLKNCIITLTTTPNRIGKIRTALISILDNSCRVEEIRINVPYYSCKGIKYIIPEWLTHLKSVKIYRTIKDWGPATKLIPTLLKYKNDKDKKIIVVDDDVIYGYYTFENLYNSFLDHNKNGRKTAITIYGDTIDQKGNTKDNCFKYFYYCQGNQYVDLLRGHASYIVTPDMFTENIFKFYQKKNQI